VAYLLKIGDWKCRAPWCNASARVILYNARNAEVGRYCHRCGERECEVIDEAEAKHAAAYAREHGLKPVR
jgi:hypothetical protein